MATGEDIQWYDAATEGNLLDANSALSDGQVVYASQIINGCESTERLDITIAIPDVHITSSDTKICSGEEVTITLDYQKPTICDMDITLTDIPFGEEISGFTYGGTLTAITTMYTIHQQHGRTVNESRVKMEDIWCV